MLTYAHNVRRLMARSGMTLRDLVNASGLHERTIKAALNGNGKPQARTLHRLAAGLGVATDELFQNSSTLSFRQFDRQTNPAVAELVRAQPDLFRDWSDADFDELCSHFGTGGELTPDGAMRVVMAIREKHAVHRKVALLLESSEAKLLTGFVELLYQKIAVTEV